jgi:hypothetical protein
MRLQDGAVTLEIYGLAIVRRENPVAAGLLKATAKRSRLVTAVGAG